MVLVVTDWDVVLTTPKMWIYPYLWPFFQSQLYVSAYDDNKYWAPGSDVASIHRLCVFTYCAPRGNIWLAAAMPWMCWASRQHEKWPTATSDISVKTGSDDLEINMMYIPIIS